MTSPEWLASYLEQGVQMPGVDVPGTAMADAARRLRVLLASPQLWSEPPGGLLDQITVSITANTASATNTASTANAANAATMANPARAARTDSRRRTTPPHPARSRSVEANDGDRA